MLMTNGHKHREALIVNLTYYQSDDVDYSNFK